MAQLNGINRLEIVDSDDERQDNQLDEYFDACNKKHVFLSFIVYNIIVNFFYLVEDYSLNQTLENNNRTSFRHSTSMNFNRNP